jgi:putative transposase
LIEPKAELSVARQCGLLDVARSSYYYESAGESALNLELMRLIDEQYMKTPFYGSPRMTEALKRKGYEVNHKRIERLMRVMCQWAWKIDPLWALKNNPLPHFSFVQPRALG